MFELAKNGLYVVATLSAGLLVAAWSLQAGYKSLFVRLGVGILVLQTSAFLAPSLILFNLLAFLAVPVLARRRDEIAGVFLFCFLTLPGVATPVAAGGTFLLSFDVLFALSAGAAATALAARGPAPRGGAALDLPVLILFVLFVTIAARGGSATNLIRVLLETSLAVLVPYFALTRSLTSVAAIRTALVGLTAAGAALSMLAVYEAANGWPLFRAVWYHFDVPLGSGASVKLRSGLLRSPGPFPEPVSFGFCLALSTLAAFAVRDLFRSGWRRTLLILLLLAGLVAPQSRGAWLGLAGGLLIADLFAGRTAALTRKAVVLAMGVAGLVAAAAVSPRIANILGLQGEGAGSLDYRSNLFERGLEEIARHPLIGASLNDVMVRLADMRQGEGIIDFVNSYIYVALVTGLVGLAALLIAIVTMLAALWRARSSWQRSGRSSGALGQGAFVFGSISAILIMLAFTSLAGRTIGMLVVCFALAATLLRATKPQPVQRPLVMAKVPA